MVSEGGFMRYDILIEIDENGKLTIKDECEIGKEQESMDEIRNLLKELADVDEIEHIPATKEKPRYEGVGKKVSRNKQSKKQRLKRGD